MARAEQDKARMRERAARMMRHWLDREEEQRRKQQARQKRATRHERPRPGRHWDEDDDAEVFEKMPKSGVAAKVRGGTTQSDTTDLPRATVVALHHGRVDLDTGASARIAARLFTSEFQLAVGDEVAFTNTEGPPRIEAVLPRHSWLSRPDPGNTHRDLLLAANVDVAVITVAVAEPPLRPGLIDRFLLALANGGVAPAICVNKVDLVADATEVERVMAPYVELQVPVFACSAARQSGLAPLRTHLAGKTCVFVGHSGVGKSSLLNTLDPDGGRQVGAVRPDGKGNHTTSWSSMRRMSDGTRIIDTPGIRALGLERLDAEQVRAGFAEFAAAGRCRFADCSHRDEPDCAVRSGAAEGRISQARYASYLRILQSLDS